MASSDGWTDKPPTVNHRREPWTRLPMPGTRTSMSMIVATIMAGAANLRINLIGIRTAK